MAAELEVEITGDISDLNRKLKQTQKSLGETGKSFNQLNEFAVGALSGIAAAFSIGAIVNFGRAVLDTTAKFQKFEAVLSNTLGSDSAAQQALVQIQQFASQTPFAVDELTSAFVKLANQGFKPTVDELRSLGDLASSTGKSFDQLAEAIIDAQVGEFERLKEFGIRAKKEGDNVTFTFKGVETQILNTSEAIQGYVLSLGNAEGVSGSMAKISETLGGKLSNLGDNIEALKLAIGDQTSGVFAASIDWLNEFINLATLAAKGVAQIREEASTSKIGAVIQANRDQVLELAKAYKEIDPSLTEQGALAKAMADVARSFREAAEGGEAFRNQNYTMSELDQINEGFIQMAKEMLNISSNTDAAAMTFEEFSKAQDKVNKAFEESGKLIELEAINLANLKRIGDEITATYDKLGATIVKGGQLGSFQELDVPLPGIAPQSDNSNNNVADLQNFTESIKNGLIESNDVFSVFLDNFREFQNLSEILAGDASFESKLSAIGSQAQLISEAFNVLGKTIASAFSNGNSALGQFLGSLISFAGKIIAEYYAIALASALAGASTSASSTGPAAIFTLPAFIGAALAIIGTAFAGIKGARTGGSSGVGGSVAQSQTFGGSGAFVNPNDSLSNVTFTIEGTTLVGVIDRTQDRYAKG